MYIFLAYSTPACAVLATLVTSILLLVCLLFISRKSRRPQPGVSHKNNMADVSFINTICLWQLDDVICSTFALGTRNITRRSLSNVKENKNLRGQNVSSVKLFNVQPDRFKLQLQTKQQFYLYIIAQFIMTWCADMWSYARYAKTNSFIRFGGTYLESALFLVMFFFYKGSGEKFEIWWGSFRMIGGSTIRAGN